MKMAPITTPGTVPIPPYAEAPPMKQAPIASISQFVPAVGAAELKRAMQTRAATAESTAMLT